MSKKSFHIKRVIYYNELSSLFSSRKLLSYYGQASHFPNRTMYHSGFFFYFFIFFFFISFCCNKFTSRKPALWAVFKLANCSNKQIQFVLLNVQIIATDLINQTNMIHYKHAKFL